MDGKEKGEKVRVPTARLSLDDLRTMPSSGSVVSCHDDIVHTMTCTVPDSASVLLCKLRAEVTENWPRIVTELYCIRT